MFKDRKDAGVQLSRILKEKITVPCTVYSIPRGGTPVGYEISERMSCPLEVLVVKKIGVPGDEEFALGAVTEGNPKELFINVQIARQLNLDKDQLDLLVERKHHEADAIAQLYRHGLEISLNVEYEALIVDDGIATGATTVAAINFLKKRGQKRIVIATPVVQVDVMAALSKIVDDVVCIYSPAKMYSVGEYYRDFSQITDQEVLLLLDNSRYRVANS